MTYQYVELRDKETDKRFSVIERLKSDDPAISPIVEDHTDLIFRHVFSNDAQATLVEELEFDCAETRILQAITNLEADFRAEGKLLMQNRKREDIALSALFDKLAPAYRPLVLLAHEEKDQYTEIPCTIDDIRLVIDYALRQGMVDYLKELQRVAEGN